MFVLRIDIFAGLWCVCAACWLYWRREVIYFFIERIMMPTGVAHRTWFPEMIEILKERWKLSVSCEGLISLPYQPDDILQRIRAERNIRFLLIWCPKIPKASPCSTSESFGSSHDSGTKSFWNCTRIWSGTSAEQSLTNLHNKSVMRSVGKLPGKDKYLSCYTWRRSVATHLLTNKVDIAYIAQLLGHASLRTTQRYLKI